VLFDKILYVSDNGNVNDGVTYKMSVVSHTQRIVST